MKSISLILLIPILVVACNGGSKASSKQRTSVSQDYSSAPEPASLAEPAAITEAAAPEAPDMRYKDYEGNSSGNTDVVNIQKKVIKTGNFTIKSEDIKASKSALDELLKKYGAYYNNESLNNDNTAIRYNLIIRVPSDKFELLVKGIEGSKDEIIERNIYAEDVTEEYVDIETRLATKRDYLNRYRQLLSKANSIKEILEIEENIRVIQEEIESSEGRLKYLTNQVNLSTLNIHLFENKPYEYKPAKEDSFFERVKFALGSGWKGIVDFIIWILAQWPFWLVCILLLPFIRKFIKKRRDLNKN
jgi:hypothetical protein